MANFHGDKVTMAELRGRLQAGIRAARELDDVKRALFNGEGGDIGLTNSLSAILAHEAPGFIAGCHADEKAFEDAEAMLCNVLGLFVESGALLVQVLTTFDRPGFGLDKQKTLGKLGAMGSHADNLLTLLGVTMDDVEADGLSPVTAERTLLEGDPELIPVFEVGKAEPVRHVPREPLKLTPPDTVGKCQTASQCPTPVACAADPKACRLAG